LGNLELTNLSPFLRAVRDDVAPPLGIARLENWPTTLADMVLAAIDEPFAWGTHDCCMWTADVVKAMSVDGIDLAAPYRGTYSDAAGAADVIDEATGGGTLEDLMVMIAAQYTLPEVAPAFAWRGDIALFDQPDPRPAHPIEGPPPAASESGPAMGIVGPDGLSAAFVSPYGLVMIDIANLRRCWRISAGTEPDPAAP
jgi:hypothetical protein